MKRISTYCRLHYAFASAQSKIFYTTLFLLLVFKLNGQTQTFTYTGANQTFTVPAGVTAITVKMWGAGGASSGGSGGSGAFVKGTLAVTSGQSYIIVVGGGGGFSTAPTFGGGGGAGTIYDGSGGGYSGIFFSSVSQTNTRGIAAGGGGGGYAYFDFNGGAGGSQNGTNAGIYNANYTGGRGGTNAAGGAGGIFNSNINDARSGRAGALFSGGTAKPGYYYGGGGGGGGYLGGGSGYSSDSETFYSSGGGGGSSYITGLTAVTNTVGTVNSTTGAMTQAPNSNETGYVSGVGNGGGTDQNGGNGLVIITYTLPCPTFTSTISIGGGTTTAGSLYPSLTAAVSDLSRCGITQPTTLSLNTSYASTAETFPITIPSIPGSSVTNKITIKPATGVTKIITGSNPNAIIKLNGTDYIIIDGSNTVGGSTKNLTISNTNNGTSSAVIWANSVDASNGATNNIIKNLNISGNSPATTFGGIIFSGASIGGIAESANINNIISGNAISSSSYGIAMVGASLDTGNIITNNNIGSTNSSSKIGYRGIFIAQQQNVEISNNIISGISGGVQAAGIFLTGSTTGGILNNNRINDIKNSDTTGSSANGIYLNSSSTANNVSVYNNMIWDISSPGANDFLTSAGVFINSGGGYKVYYNSINITAAPTATTSISSNVIINTNVGALDIRNNVFVNTSSAGLKYNIYSFGTNSALTDINYNNYYSNGSVGYLGSDRTTFADWQSATTKDVNSINIQPFFVSATDLHISPTICSGLESAGTPIAGITNDIDLATRSTTTPDIGADEFTGIIPLKINSVTNGANCGTGSVILGAVGEIGTTQYFWYATAHGGAPLQTTTTGSFTTPSISSTTTYYVAAASASCTGNIRRAVVATINPAPTDVVLQSQIVYPSGATGCDLDYVKLDATGGIGTVNIASGTNAFTSNVASATSTLGPNPLQNYYGGSKQQWIYTASELTTLGFNPGSTIKAIQLNLATANSSYALQNFRIKMKNSATASFPTTGSWETGMTTVRNTASYVPVVGLNNFVLDSPFIWNGNSNLVIEINYTNNNSPTTGNNSARFTNTSFVSTIFYRDDNLNANDVDVYSGSASTFLYSSRNDVLFVVDDQKITWSPPTGLYTDPALTIPYVAGAHATTLYAAPDVLQSYSASSSMGTCAKSVASTTVIRTKKVFTGASATPTLWNVAGNWSTNTLPSSDKCVVIPNGKTVAIDISNAVAKSVTVQAGGKLTINANQTLTVQDAFKNQAGVDDVKIATDGNLLQINPSKLINSGSITAERNVTGLRYNPTATVPAVDFIYWSSPVEGQKTKGSGGFSPGTTLSQFADYRESNNRFYTTTDADFVAGKGYSVQAENDRGISFTRLFTFKGAPHNGDISIPLLRSTTGSGYNLVGNPYPSNIDFNELYLANNGLIWNTAWFWTNATYQQYQAGSGYTGNNYAIYNGTGGVTGTSVSSNGIVPNGFVKLGQGFMVQAKTVGGGILSFKNTYSAGHNLRVADSTPFAYKNATEKNRYSLRLIAPTTLVNTQLIGYILGATNGFEKDYDASSFGLTSDLFYSVVGTSRLLIQGRDAHFMTQDKVALGVNFFHTGNYTIELGTKEGIFAGGQNIYLKDRQNNVITNLSQGSYTFAATSGDNNSRFEIIYEPETILATDEKGKDQIIVYRENGDFVIQSSKEIERVEVYDPSGKLVKALSSKSKKVVIDSSALINGMYILKIKTSEGGIYSKKVVR